MGDFLTIFSKLNSSSLLPELSSTCLLLVFVYTFPFSDIPCPFSQAPKYLRPSLSATPPNWLG